MIQNGDINGNYSEILVIYNGDISAIEYKYMVISYI